MSREKHNSGCCENCNSHREKQIVEAMERYKRVELTVDDVIGDTHKSLHQWVWDAYKEAVKEDIKANTIVINKHFAKVNAHAFSFNCIIHDMPPMICGLEVRLSEELPEGYDFGLYEAYQTERDRLVHKAKTETAREIFEEANKIFMATCWSLETYKAWCELKEKYIQECES